MNNLKKVENLDNVWVTYFAKEKFTYDDAMTIIRNLQKDREIKTFTVYALLFFGYGHEVVQDNINEVEKCLEVFTQYKLNLTEIKYSAILKDVMLLFE